MTLMKTFLVIFEENEHPTCLSAALHDDPRTKSPICDYDPGFSRNRRVDITESSSVQFPTRIFNSWPFGKLGPDKKNFSILLKYATFEGFFFIFLWAKFFLFLFFLYCCVRTKKMVNKVRFFVLLVKVD